MLADYEVWRVQPPGRPPRTAETPATDIEAWLAPIAHELQAWNDAPWCIYGHSMGALVAVEAAQRTIDAGGRAPLVAFVAACAAPHPDRRRARLSTLPEREFQHALERFGGTPPAILEDPALLTLLSGAVRADLAVLESHVPRALGSYEFPIVALAGTADRAVSIQEAETWRQCGKRQFRFYKIAGGHFFLQTSRAQVIECIQMELERFLD
jgi:surfactin synthase thioesterase subunit